MHANVDYQRQDPDANSSRIAEHHHGSDTNEGTTVQQVVYLH